MHVPRPATGALTALALVLAGGVAAAGAAHATPSPDAPLVINEVYGGGGNSGATYDRDFVELYNASDEPVDTAGWSVQYASAAGTVYQVTPLTGVVAPGGYLLVAEAAGAGGTVPVAGNVVGTIPMSATSGKVALVSSRGPLTCGSTCSSAPEVVDLVGYGAASDFAGSGAAPGLSSTTSASRDADHTNTADNAADFTAGAPTPRGAGDSDGEEPPGGTYTIAEIQGTGATSPLVGATVTTSGVVTAAYPTGGFDGYVIQTPGTGGPLDPTRAASDAIFVFSPATVGQVEVGDHVRVTGQVGEYGGLTEITVAAGGLTILDTSAQVEPLTGAWPATAEAREAIESMLLLPTGDLTVTNTYATNQYGEVGLAVGTTPLLQPTEVARPGSPEAAAVAADNAARGVVLDDGATTNFLSAANRSLTPPYVSLTNPVRVGAAATFDEPVVVDHRNDTWKLNPTRPLAAGADAPVTFENDRTASPQDVGGDLRVATFNVLNYFTTLGADDAATCRPYRDRTGDPVTVESGCDQRGAWDPDDLQRQQEKIVAAIEALDADVVGLLEIENSAVVDGVPDEAVATLVDALNDVAGDGTWAYVPSSDELPPVDQQDVITNAIVYRPAAVTPTGPSRALGDQSGPGQAFVNAREPIGQVFTPVGSGEPFLVVVNHLKSKGSAGPWPGDADAGDGQGASNESRVRQTTALRDWVPTVQGDAEAVVLVGDLNAYTQEDPLQVLYDAGYVDAVATLAPGQYSYSFSGLSGSLDHVLLNAAAAGRVTGADVWEINAEESIALEYSRFNYHGTTFHAPDPYRSSDHDPVLVGLTAGEANDGPVELTFLNVNDFHGRIDGNTVAFAGTVEEQRAAADGPVAFLSAGDNIGASLFASSVQQDQPTIDVLDALDLAASAVGNHEFDAGYEDLVERVIADGTNARFPYLGANVYLEGTTTPAFDEYALLDMDGVTVGVIGAVTQETPTLVRPDGIAGLDFGDPVEAVNRVAAQLTDGDPANGEADVIVAEYHEGAGAGTPDGSSLEDELAAGGAFAAVVTGTDPAVDVIFTGHTHKQYAWFGPVGDDDRTRPVVQTGSYGEHLGKVVLTYDPATDEVVEATAQNVARTTTPAETLVATYPRVAQVAQVVADALAVADEVGSQPVGSVTADVTTAFSGGLYVDGVYVGPGPEPTTGRDDRSRESTLGSLVADALLETLAAPERGGAQIGVVNPGGLRAELLHAPDGTVTYAEANAVLPFVNNLWTTTLTGAQVVTMLEQQWQTDEDGEVPSRPYLQLGLSANVSYTYDASRPLGDRVTSVTVDGEPIDLDGEYRIGTFSFLAQGGDNFRVFRDGARTADSGLVDRDAWIAYLQAHPGVAPDVRERAVAVPALEPVTPGGELTFEVGGLNLTSLGAPQNTQVEVRLGDDVLGTFPLEQATDGPEASGTVAVTVPAGLAPGQHLLTLVASPSGTTATVPVTVDARAVVSTTTLTAEPSTQVVGTRGARVRLTAQVTADAPVSGAVEFVAGDEVLGTAPLRGGRAVLTLPPGTPVGEYAVVARWAGTDEVAGSQSAPVTVTVVRATSRTSLHVVQSPVPRLLPSAWVATVGLDNGRPASGRVELREGQRVVARAHVVLGVAIGAVPRDIGAGTHRLTAVFVPDAPDEVAGSASAVVSVRG